MKPLNQKQRNIAFTKFLSVFLMTLAFAGITMFYSFKSSDSINDTNLSCLDDTEEQVWLISKGALLESYFSEIKDFKNKRVKLDPVTDTEDITTLDNEFRKVQKEAFDLIINMKSELTTSSGLFKNNNELLRYYEAMLKDKVALFQFSKNTNSDCEQICNRRMKELNDQIEELEETIERTKEGGKETKDDCKEAINDIKIDLQDIAHRVANASDKILQIKDGLGKLGNKKEKKEMGRVADEVKQIGRELRKVVR